FLDEKGNFPEHSGSLVLCVSLQDLDIDEQGNVKDRLKKVLETKWDLLIFDEVHFGGRTDRVKNILKYLSPTYRLDLSGTPFRLIETIDFCPEQVFTYSYLDEQKNKRQEIQDDPEKNQPFIYRQMPNMNLSTIEITDKDIKTQREKFMTDDRDFSLNELFKSNSSGFIHNDAVDHFLESLSKREHGATALSVYGKLGEQLGLPKRRHSVWWLNRVQSIRQLIKKLKRHFVFSQYEIINAAGGDAGDDFSDDDLPDEIFAKNKQDIINKIEKVNSDKINKMGTITLTCRKFLTGVTIKQWDSILILNDIQSAESYFQAIFRIQSAWFDKQHKEVLKPVGFVFDFAISRCLRTTYDYADALTDQLDQQDSHRLQICRDNLKTVIDGLCNTLDIKQFYEGSLRSDPVTSRQIFEAVSSEGSKVALARRITSDALVSFPSLALLEKHPHLFEALKNVKGYRSQQAGSLEDFIKIGDEAKRKKLEKDKLEVSNEKVEKDNEDFVEKETDKEKKNKKKWYATQIKRLAICMADFVYMTKFREYKIDHVIETKDAEFFKSVTGISKDHFSELCDKGFIHRESLNRIVREFRHQEESSLKPEEYIFEHIQQTMDKQSA
ncbi:MAG: DEAD/DEAH box helicase family protein, partial [Bdellovibrionales bacterium]|nr:DEAD/DEAH box helicase family protein [Bdellovibrionales bacterium]